MQVSASDDQTAVENLGYQIEVATGRLPDGLVLPTGAVRTLGGNLFLGWIDGASDDQEPLSFSLTIRAVDLAGNVGPPVTVTVADPGSGSGCVVAARPLPSTWPTTTLAILFAAYLWRRRRAVRASA